MGVCKYLDLSTSHLSAMGRLFLANPEKFEKEGEVVVCPKSYGWIFSTGKMSTGRASQLAYRTFSG